ncbi:MAG: hypothetical protein Q9177_001981 [Variospora cf. flavescens]
MSSTNAANAAANTAASASFALCLASRKTPGPTASGITILHLAALKRKAPKAAAAPPEHDPTHSGVTYYDLARFDVIGQSPNNHSATNYSSGETVPGPSVDTFHRQLTEADTDHLLAQDDLALFLQDLDRFKTAPTAFLPRRTPAPRPPTSPSSSTQSFETAAEEPENVLVAIDAAIKGSINDSSSQEEDDPVDEESFRLEVEVVILEDLSSSCSDDDTTDDGELSEDKE